jgi:hypothetical protein
MRWRMNRLGGFPGLRIEILRQAQDRLWGTQIWEGEEAAYFLSSAYSMDQIEPGRMYMLAR